MSCNHTHLISLLNEIKYLYWRKIEINKNNFTNVPNLFSKKATIGRLFEPMTPEANLKVYEAMIEIFGNHRNTLIGVNDYMVADNEWVYSSG